MTIDATDEAPLWPRGGELGDKALTYVFAAFRGMPDVFVLMACLVLVLDIVAGSLNGRVHFLGTAAHDIFARQPSGARFLILGALWLAPLIVTACVAVAVHRFVLLQETTSGFGPLMHRYAWAFAAWLIGIGLLEFVVDIPMPLALRILALVPVIIVDIRISLLFPAVAVGAAEGSMVDRLQASWRRTRGHVLSLLYASIVTTLPLLGIIIVLVLVEFFILGPSSQADSSGGLIDLLKFLLSSVGSVYEAMCAAAIASLAYRAALDTESATR